LLSGIQIVFNTGLMFPTATAKPCDNSMPHESQGDFYSDESPTIPSPL
jgi:hypothetical protein